ncbi:MAG: hypothetical protein QHC65_11030 [Sphingomonas sp.]|nr:hypothetical protein [Sphingomonas sp.]MDX3884947.1 hypothetical protein [Sphingomonas sp.]
MSAMVLQPKASRPRRPLLSSSAIAAIAAAVAHGPAAAQSFQGGVISSTPGVTVNNGIPGQTTVTVNAPSAIINWRPDDNAAGGAPIEFQPAGTSATFQGASDFTVLNRILPDGAAAGRSVLLNGNIGSSVDGARGGAVWFYSPNGLIIGSQATIDVGSLLLTTRDLADADFLDGNGIYNFGAADNSRSTVTIQPGAQIDARYDSGLGGAYVAVVAPRIAQGGSVRVDGSAAYVAGEQARITINNGLFNIEVQSGSAVNAGTAGDDVTLSHTGSTTGPASSGAGDPQSIYMVAIPKNVAVTMLVGGTVGYDAAFADVQNGTVVLSAGSNLDSSGNPSTGPASGVGAGIRVEGGTFTSQTALYARTDALVSTAGGPLAFDQGLSVTAGRNAVLQAGAGDSLTVGGNLFVSSLNRDDAGGALRGTAAVDVGAGASLSVTGVTTIDASIFDFGNVQGGTARLTGANGASIDTQSLFIRAGADSFDGSARGGDALLSLTGATLDAGDIFISAGASGGTEDIAADAFGGNATVTLANASLSVSGQLYVDASGFGGNAQQSGGTGGSGTGGNVRLSVTGAASDIQVDGQISLAARGEGGGNGSDSFGNGITGGNGTGGTAIFDQSAGALSAGGLLLDVAGLGGNGTDSAETGFTGGSGGNGTGGSAAATQTGGSLFLGGLDVLANGIGGFGGRGFDFGYGDVIDGGDGGNGAGGNATVAIGALFAAGSIILDVSATGGEGGQSDAGMAGNGGSALGGGWNGTGGGSLSFADATLSSLGSVAVLADAAGGAGAMRGGDASAGRAALSFRDSGLVNLPSATIDVSARGGDASATGGTAGSATAGSGAFTASGSSISSQAFSFAIIARGGDAFDVGHGGDATGGSMEFRLADGDLSLGGGLDIQADAGGGSGRFGGSGHGGRVAVDIDTATLTLGSNGRILLTADGTGRGIGSSTDFTSDDIGGSATGGTVSLRLSNTTQSVARGVTLSASAEGGSSGGAGGSGSGGDISLALENGAFLDIGNGLVFDASARGGDGTAGGAAEGGDISLALSGGARLSAAMAIDLDATAYGGIGGYAGNGGDARGGSILLDIAAASAESLIDIGYGIVAYADAYGGGSTGQTFSSEGFGGTGGSGTGGDIRVNLASGGIGSAFSSTFSAIGRGGNTASNNGNAGTGMGGNIEVSLAGGTFAFAGLSLDTTGIGGNAGESGYGDGGDGGAGTGGTAALRIGPGGVLQTDYLDIIASGTGGDGSVGDLAAAGTGGAGRGGTASLLIEGGAFSGMGITVSADADGGSGGGALGDAPAGIGGAGTGGSATFRLAGGTVEVSGATVSASGNGGFGGYASGTGTGGANGGAGTGGTASLRVESGNLAAGYLSAIADARGGYAGYGMFDGPLATGGAAQGGLAELTLQPAGAVTADMLEISAGATGYGSPYSLVGDARGGTARIATSGGSLAIGSGLSLSAGASIRGEGGADLDVIGGTVSFSASNGTAIDYGPGSLTLDASAAILPGEGSGEGEGGEGSESFAFAAAAAAGNVVGGSSSLTLDGVTLNLTGDLVLDGGSGAATEGAAAQGGSVTLAVRNGGLLTVGGGATLSAIGGDAASGGTVTVNVDNGTIRVADSTAITSGGDVVFAASGTGLFDVGGDLAVVAGNDIRSSHAQPADPVDTIRAARASFQAGGDVDLGNGTIVNAGAIDITANGAASASTLRAQGDIAIAAATIAIDTLSAGGGISLAAESGDIRITSDIAAGGPIDLTGAGIYLRSQRDLSLAGLRATSGDIDIGSTGTLDLANIEASGSIRLDGTDISLVDARAGDRIVLTASGFAMATGIAATGDIDISALGAIDLAGADAGGSIRLDSRDVRLVDAHAGSAIDVTARGLATLDGTIDARTISVGSYDIAIGTGQGGTALIGLDTDSITLTNIGEGISHVGGGNAEGWSLSNDEFGRLAAHDINIVANGDMDVGRLDVIGSAGEDGEAGRRRNLLGSELRLGAGGTLRVVDAISLTGAADSDRLILAANDRILVDTATGSIRIANASGGLGGTLALDAPTIFVGTAQAWTDISGMADINARNDRLANSDGIDNAEGFLLARGMEFRAGRGLYIQNSTADATAGGVRGGFTVGEGGLALIAAGQTTEVVINGRQALADGTFLTGEALVRTVTLRGEGSGSMAGFYPRSTINGCLLIGLACSIGSSTPIGIPQQDVIAALDPDEDDGQGESTGLVRSLNTPVIQFADAAGITTDPVIEQPVTGAGNEDLWLDTPDGGLDTVGQQVTGTRKDDEDQEKQGSGKDRGQRQP